MIVAASVIREMAVGFISDIYVGRYPDEATEGEVGCWRLPRWRSIRQPTDRASRCHAADAPLKQDV